MKKINRTSLVFIGIVPLLGTTGRLYYAFWASLSFLIILMLSSLAAQGIRRLIAGRARLVAYTAVAAVLTSAASMFLQAYAPAAEAGIGVCLSFLAANALVLWVCEASAENGFKACVENSAVCGVSGAAILLVTAAVRELLQYGTLFSRFGGGEGVRIFSDWFSNVEFAGTSAGALIIFGLIAGSARKIAEMKRIRHRNCMLRQERIVSGCHPDLVMDAATGKVVRRTTAELLDQQRHPIETIAENNAGANNTSAENEMAEFIEEKAKAENGGEEDDA